ncbi:MAG: sulfurtransferase [Cyanobacteria bacterium SZAS TMP-1]|nr:sulfurtransferase [Cyanobacteria bacterium SZAS TMP-1]
MSRPISLIKPYELLALAAAGRKFTLVDARPNAEFIKGHLPSAIQLDWEDYCEKPEAPARDILLEPGYWGKLQEPYKNSLDQKLSIRGISSGDLIIVYAEGKHSKGRDARIAWMLSYLGVEEVAILDGGIDGWQATGGTLGGSSPVREPGKFVMALQEHRRIQLEELSTIYGSDPDLVVVDTRSQAEFYGHSMDYQPRLGHIPGAINLPFDALYKDLHNFQPKNKYLDMLPPVVKKAKKIVAYCEVGVRATALAFLHEIYTDQVVRVYDGSIMEWSSVLQLPITQR